MIGFNQYENKDTYPVGFGLESRRSPDGVRFLAEDADLAACLVPAAEAGLAEVLRLRGRLSCSNLSFRAIQLWASSYMHVYNVIYYMETIRVY